MSESGKDKQSGWSEWFAFWPLIGALLASLGFGWFALCLALEETVHGTVTMTRWAQFLQGKPNELGDTLAGFVGSLTLVWVVASVIQQSMELRAQRREFAAMVLAQGAQVEALKAQAAIFEDEKRRRDEAEAEKTLDQHLKAIDQSFREERALQDSFSFFANGFPAPRHTPFNSMSKAMSEQNIASLATSVEEFLTYVCSEAGSAGRLSKKSHCKVFYKNVLDAIEKALAIKDCLSEAQKVKVDRLRLEAAQVQLNALLAADIWEA